MKFKSLHLSAESQPLGSKLVWLAGWDLVFQAVYHIQSITLSSHIHHMQRPETSHNVKPAKWRKNKQTNKEK